MKKPELLAPAGNLEKLKAAINFGADAVYLGGNKLNLTASAGNFSLDDLKEGIDFAHLRGKKVYVTVNIFPHNEDLVGLEDYLTDIQNVGADAIIAADPGIIATAKEVIPDMEIHLSTQANCTNYKAALFWHSMGIKRLVVAREMSLNELTELRSELPHACEIEAFVHGSMCISYSGRCLLSNYMTGQDANRGECAQPCRYKYHLVEEKRPGEYYNITQDGNGTYIMNSKDLCMIEYIPQLIEAGIGSFKIEGRMKSSFYVASVVKAYREAIDLYTRDPAKYEFDPKWMEYLVKPSHRPFTTGFYFGEEIKQHYQSSSYIRDYDIIGIVMDYDEKSKTAVIEQRNKAFSGDSVEILTQKGDNKIIKLNDMRNQDGTQIDSAPNAKMIFTIQCDMKLKNGDIIIKQNARSQ